ncbi:hypothetical protein ABZ863_20085 [Saccharomonospora sp. NPDC046836]|uniref:phage shock envelope stress response protein PspM n=1 Tax=Saccharomonospora sp. NPDC046836 TaxID=3156921 RepID=UPI0033D84EF5
MTGRQGKRDFSEFNAKLEKHLERLPDYAQRAQEKLQKFMPPPSQSAEQDRQAGDGRVPRPPVRPIDLTAVTDMRDKFVRWNEPAAKLERRKRRTSRAVTLWTILTLLSVLWAVGGFYGITSSQEGFVGAFSGLTAVVIFGVLGVRSGLRLRQLNRTEVPARTEPPRLPPTSSVARKPMERLAESEATLAELLGQLGTPTPGAAASVPAVSVEDAKATAAEAAAALRALATRIQSIERARAAAPASERAALGSAIKNLRAQLDDGLNGYGSLVAAAGRAVAESSGGVQPAKEALTDATDRLAGLALALRELS